MPIAPNVDGLPVWLQIALSAVFALMTILVAVRGYRNGAVQDRREDPKTTIAHLADMGAVRHLSDTCNNLNASVIALDRSVSELTHWLRDQNEIEREVAQRLRELREVMDRRGGVRGRES